MLMPLAQVNLLAIVAEVGAGKVRTSDPIVFTETATGSKKPKVTIVVRTFSEVKIKRFTSGHSCPRDARCIGFFEHFPCAGFDPIKAPQIARTHPERTLMPG
jgi:uncharacterized Fe-S center protein